MGSKLENVKKNVEKASEMEARGLEQGEKDSSEVKEIKSIIDGMDKEVDDEIVAGMEATKEAAKGEGAQHMESVVHGMLDEGYQVGGEAISEGTDQAGRSRQASADFKSVSGTSEFGRSTAESNAQQAENMATQFENLSDTAQQGIESTEDRYKNLLDEIRG